MCDLTPAEAGYIQGVLAEISTLVAQINSNAESITERSFMDHEGLSALLAALAAQANSAARWVAAKPHEHAGHEGHEPGIGPPE